MKTFRPGKALQGVETVRPAEVCEIGSRFGGLFRERDDDPDRSGPGARVADRCFEMTSGSGDGSGHEKQLAALAAEIGD